VYHRAGVRGRGGEVLHRARVAGGLSAGGARGLAGVGSVGGVQAGGLAVATGAGERALTGRGRGQGDELGPGP